MLIVTDDKIIIQNLCEFTIDNDICSVTNFLFNFNDAKNVDLFFKTINDVCVHYNIQICYINCEPYYNDVYQDTSFYYFINYKQNKFIKHGFCFCE